MFRTIFWNLHSAQERSRDLIFPPCTTRGYVRSYRQDKDYFKDFTLDGFTVGWNNEIGFAPEYTTTSLEINEISSTLEPNNILYSSDYQIIHSILIVI